MMEQKFSFIDFSQLPDARTSDAEAERLCRVICDSVAKGVYSVIDFLNPFTITEEFCERSIGKAVKSSVKNKGILPDFIAINVSTGVRNTLLEASALQKNLKANGKVMPIFGEYLDLIGWAGVEDKMVTKALTKLVSEKRISEKELIGISCLSEEQKDKLLTLLKINSGFFKEQKDSQGSIWEWILETDSMFEAEIKNLITKTGAHLTDQHLRLSSGKHVNEYIQTDLLFKYPYVAERLAKGLYNLFKDVPFDVIVTFSILGSELTKSLITTFHNKENRKPDYIFTDDYRNPRITHQMGSIAGNALIILDVNSSGGLVGRLGRLIERQGGKVTGVGVVVDCGNYKNKKYVKNVKSLCSYKIKLENPEQCPLCEEDKPLHTVKYGSVAEIVTREEDKDKTIEIYLKEQNHKMLDFWKKVDCCKALNEHVYYKGRHYFLYVNTAKIFDSAFLLEEITERMIKHYKPLKRKFSVILHGPSPGARFIAQGFSKKSGGSIPLVRMGETDSEGGFDIQPQFKKYLLNNHIMIIDDGTNTGGTLKKLFNLARKYGAKEIDVCVFLDRLIRNDRAEILNLFNHSKDNKVFFPLNTISIPTHVEDNNKCLFCMELDDLKSDINDFTPNYAREYCVRRVSEIKCQKMETIKIEANDEILKSPEKLHFKDFSSPVRKAICLDLKSKYPGSYSFVNELASSATPTEVKSDIIECLNENDLAQPGISRLLLSLLEKIKSPVLIKSILRTFVKSRKFPFISLLPQIVKKMLVGGGDIAFLSYVIYKVDSGDSEIITEIRKVIDKYKQSAVEKKDKKKIVETEKLEEGLNYHLPEIVWNSDKMKEVMDVARQAAPSESTMLLTGESGTGKELLAKDIHSHHNNRCKMPFITVDCGLGPESLLESDLFGHEKGAFTHAIKQKLGKFELAKRGAIFLDEVGNLSPYAQAKLLRVIQDKSFERVGGTETLQADVRIIAATNKNLEQAMADGSFREDLYHRLNVIPIHLPPLRERKEDIPLLVKYFLKRYNGNCVKEKCFSKKAMKELMSYDYPGNVRQLENIVERNVVLAKEDVIDKVEFHVKSFTPPKEKKYSNKKELEKQEMKRALEDNNYDPKKTMKHLNMPKATFYRKLKDYKLGKRKS